VNILFLDQFSDLGGAQHCMLDLVPAIQARGWHMSCALPGNGRLIERLDERGVAVHPLPDMQFSSGRKSLVEGLRFGFNTPRLAREIARLARETHADLVYVNGPRVLPAAAWVARTTGRPLVFHCHNHLAQRSAALLAGSSLRLAGARMIACCRYVARPLWPYIDPGRLHVIYNGVREPSSPRPARTDCAVIGVIGRISPEKGQAEFVRAARILESRRPGSRFVVCGAPLFANCEAARYFDRVRELATGLAVAFPGWQEDVGAVLADLDVLVVPSLREPGAPRVILEAYAARVPVVAFASGGIPEILTHGETGFLVEPPEPEKLAMQLERLLDAPELLRAIANRAYDYWREKFTVEQYRREVLEVIGKSSR
jgi:glycosyltransferase involved in cell wall biosynthesis